MKNKKRMLCLITAAMLCAGSLAGCGSTPREKEQADAGVQSAGQSQESKAETDVPETEAGGKKNGEAKLVIASSANWTKDIDKSLAEKFTEETGIEVEFQITPDDQYTNVLKAKLSTGEGPDIFLTQSGVAMNELLPDENFLDLSNEPWVSRLVDWAKAGTTYEGKVIAMNLWSADGWGILYDPAKFEKAGITEVPKTYEQFSEACEKLSQAGYTPIYSCGSAVWHQPLWLNGASSLAEKTDPDYLNSFNSNKLNFADIPEYETALTQLKELIDKGYFGKDYMSATWENSLEEMASGKYGMILTYTTYPNELQAINSDINAENWEMFPVPLADNDVFIMSAGGVVHAINKNSSNIEAAKEYLNFRARLDNVEAFYKARPDLGEAAFNDYKGVVTKAYESVIQNSSKTMLDLQTGISFFDTSIIGNYFQELYMGSKTPKQVLEAIDTDRQQMFEVME